MSHRQDTLPDDSFARRHIGPRDGDIVEMLAALGVDSLDALIDETIPASIRLAEPLRLDPPRSEHELLAELRDIARQNEIRRSLIGMGYYDTITPPVIQRNILENPGWYTQYTPYQAEISQGRLEALLNFQTLVADLTGLPLANASLLDEATAAAEAMTMCRRISRGKASAFFVAADCHPQTIAVVQTRAEPLGIDVVVGDPQAIDFDARAYFGVLLQYPDTFGTIRDYGEVIERAHAAGALVVVATDLLALTLLKPPGAFGADIAVGSAQRFGVPMGFGGPHAAFLATHEKHLRQVPGRIVGVSKDAHGRPAYRLTVQTREQHIRRDKATSNICTAQVLLAIMASMYAVYHGPDGLRRIAMRVHRLAAAFAAGLRRLGFDAPDGDAFFDTLRIECGSRAEAILRAAEQAGFNLRVIGGGALGVSFDEKSTEAEIERLLACFAEAGAPSLRAAELLSDASGAIDSPLARRKVDYLAHPVFHRYRAEHEMLRYMHRLQSRDLSLAHSMIPLGSCTMKLNATAEMMPITWPEFAHLHPFAPPSQARGYQRLFEQLQAWLAEITGLPGVSLQPNAGAQGEYSGLLAIRAYHAARGQHQRDVCLIPVSAHGTNPASAVLAGLQVVAVACDERGNIDLCDLRAKAEQHRERLAALMITYPSTHGVFEESVRDVCAIVHEHGGQVYMDGANMNAQCGLCRPGDIGADVCHLNLHKTFCIPHGGGGPGMGPICVAEHLKPFLPGHPLSKGTGGRQPATASGESGAEAVGPVAAAPFGSAGILPISWMYIGLMGAEGLRRASQVAILNANYMAHRLKDHYRVLYTGAHGRCAHEFIIDLREFRESAGVEIDDVAKRLMDFGFHAPTMSWPVAGTLMIEPTESESKEELDRFCDAMIAIREEIRAIEKGRLDRDENPLKNAPHTAADVTADQWPHPYSRTEAAWPAAWLREGKFWPPVSRIDNVYGDRHPVCACPPVEAYEP